MSIKDEIRAAAKAQGISQMGITKAEVYSDLGAVLRECGKIPASGTLEERINPFLLMPEARAVIVFLFPYFDGNGDGNISKYARGTDYHAVIRKKLAPVAEYLYGKGYRAEIYADTSPLNDRYMARRAGLGFIGRNGFLINPVYGSYTFIGYIITDCPLPPDSPLDKRCGECMRCVRACPGGALSENHRFDAEKCLSYITQKKGELSEREKRLMREAGTVWGCDICQDVCPLNKGARRTEIAEFTENPIAELKTLGDISNREFKRRYKDRAFAWRGKAVLERNIGILFGETEKND